MHSGPRERSVLTNSEAAHGWQACTVSRGRGACFAREAIWPADCALRKAVHCRQHTPPTERDKSRRVSKAGILCSWAFFQSCQCAAREPGIAGGLKIREQTVKLLHQDFAFALGLHDHAAKLGAFQL